MRYIEVEYSTRLCINIKFTLPKEDFQILPKEKKK